jgi:hypothetical protein
MAKVKAVDPSTLAPVHRGLWLARDNEICYIGPSYIRPTTR